MPPPENNRLSMIGLAAMDHQPPLPGQPTLVNGFHLRWSLGEDSDGQQLGFPKGGFYIARQPAKDSKAVSWRCEDFKNKLPDKLPNRFQGISGLSFSCDSGIQVVHATQFSQPRGISLKNEAPLRASLTADEETANAFKVTLGFLGQTRKVKKRVCTDYERLKPAKLQLPWPRKGVQLTSKKENAKIVEWKGFSKPRDPNKPTKEIRKIESKLAKLKDEIADELKELKLSSKKRHKAQRQEIIERFQNEIDALKDSPKGSNEKSLAELRSILVEFQEKFEAERKRIQKRSKDPKEIKAAISKLKSRFQKRTKPLEDEYNALKKGVGGVDKEKLETLNKQRDEMLAEHDASAESNIEKIYHRAKSKIEPKYTKEISRLEAALKEARARAKKDSAEKDKLKPRYKGILLQGRSQFSLPGKEILGGDLQFVLQEDSFVTIDAVLPNGKAVESFQRKKAGEHEIVLPSGIASLRILIKGAALLRNLCYTTIVEESIGGLVDVPVRLYSGDDLVGTTVWQGEAGTQKTFEVRGSELTAIEFDQSKATLLGICWQYIEEKALGGSGWEILPSLREPDGLDHPIGLPVDHADYDCPGKPSNEAGAIDLCKRKTETAPDFDGDKWFQNPVENGVTMPSHFEKFHEALQFLVEDGPTPMTERERSYPEYDPANDPHNLPDESIPRQRPFDLLNIASLDPSMARLMGLYHVDLHVREDERWNYLLIADLRGHFTSGLPLSSDEHPIHQALTDISPLIEVSNLDDPLLDICFLWDQEIKNAPPLAPPTEVKAYALPSISQLDANGEPSLDTNRAGVRWAGLGGFDGYDISHQAVMGHVWRQDLGLEPLAPDNPPSPEPANPLACLTRRIGTDGFIEFNKPIIPPDEEAQAELLALHEEGPPLITSDRPPEQMFYVEQGLKDSWYAYSVTGVDLFGRHSDLSERAHWMQWITPEGDEPWYFKPPIGDGVRYENAISLLDKVQRAMPSMVEATLLDPKDPYLLRDKLYQDWEAARDTLRGTDPVFTNLTQDEQDRIKLKDIALRVSFLWHPDHVQQAPDTREFRIYWKEGNMASLDGETSNVGQPTDPRCSLEVEISSEDLDEMGWGYDANTNNEDLLNDWMLIVESNVYTVVSSSIIAGFAHLTVRRMSHNHDLAPRANTACTLVPDYGYNHDQFWEKRCYSLKTDEDVTMLYRQGNLVSVSGTSVQTDLPTPSDPNVYVGWKVRINQCEYTVTSTRTDQLPPFCQDSNHAYYDSRCDPALGNLDYNPVSTCLHHSPDRLQCLILELVHINNHQPYHLEDDQHEQLDEDMIVLLYKETPSSGEIEDSHKLLATRKYDLILPGRDASGSDSTFDLLPDYAESTKWALVGVSSADDKEHTHDNWTGDDPAHRGTDHYGNEGFIAQPAKVYQVLRDPPPAPAVAPYPARLYATAPDYHGKSYFGHRFPGGFTSNDGQLLTPRVHIYRALADGVFLEDWMWRAKGEPLLKTIPTSQQPESWNDRMPGWTVQEKGAVELELNAFITLLEDSTQGCLKILTDKLLEAPVCTVPSYLPPQDATDAELELYQIAYQNNENIFIEKAQEVYRESAAKIYKNLSDNVIRVLASMTHTQDAYTQVTIDPIDAQETQYENRIVQSDLADHVIDTADTVTRIYRDDFGGGDPHVARFYKSAYVDPALNLGAESLASPPVYVRYQHAPPQPIVTKVMAKDRLNVLQWRPVKERNADHPVLREYLLYRTQDKDAVGNTRKMDLVGRMPAQVMELNANGELAVDFLQDGGIIHAIYAADELGIHDDPLHGKLATPYLRNETIVYPGDQLIYNLRDLDENPAPAGKQVVVVYQRGYFFKQKLRIDSVGRFDFSIDLSGLAHWTKAESILKVFVSDSNDQSYTGDNSDQLLGNEHWVNPKKPILQEFDDIPDMGLTSGTEVEVIYRLPWQAKQHSRLPALPIFSEGSSLSLKGLEAAKKIVAVTDPDETTIYSGNADLSRPTLLTGLVDPNDSAGNPFTSPPVVNVVYRNERNLIVRKPRQMTVASDGSIQFRVEDTHGNVIPHLSVDPPPRKIMRVYKQDELGDRDDPLKGESATQYLPEPKALTRPTSIALSYPVYELSLTSVSTPANLTDTGESLVIVALIGADLHIRIFDGEGQIVVDKTESQLTNGQELDALKVLPDAETFPNVSQLSLATKQEIIDKAVVVSGHTPPTGEPLPNGTPLKVEYETGKLGAVPTAIESFAQPLAWRDADILGGESYFYQVVARALVPHEESGEPNRTLDSLVSKPVKLIATDLNREQESLI